MRKILIAVAIIMACILGYGYWHSATHASLNVYLNVRNSYRDGSNAIRNAEILFLDPAGRRLASGIGDPHYNYVRLIHPELGDCYEVEKDARSSRPGREAWQACFERLSTWIPGWADKVSQVNLKIRDCTLKNIPVTVSKRNADWLLWWVPHPHIGGKPYTYYSLSITVDEKNCVVK